MVEHWSTKCDKPAEINPKFVEVNDVDSALIRFFCSEFENGRFARWAIQATQQILSQSQLSTQ